MVAKTQTCRKCGVSKPLSEFDRDRRTKKKIVYKSVCMACSPNPDQGKSDRPREIGLPWDKDPAILQRLEIVSTLMSQGLRRPHQIQKAMASSYDYGYTWDTAKEDIGHVEELNLRATMGDISQKRANSLERIYHAIMRVWESYNKVASSEISKKEQIELRHKLLALVEKFEGRITELEGTRMPTRIIVDSLPIPLDVQEALQALERNGVSRFDVMEEIFNSLIEAAREAQGNVIDASNIKGDT